jgi:hypothetical protein
MNADEFRRIALALRGSVEGSHQHHPDFRVHGKIYASLGYPEPGWGMVKLTPAQQARFVALHPDCFQCVKGAWGRRGATSINLFGANPTLARRALALAHRNVSAAQHRAVPRSYAEHAPARPAKQRAS